MPRIKAAPPRVRAADSRRVKPPDKRAETIYSTPEYQRWRATVIARAGHRCEAVENGMRCRKSAPRHRLFADHIVEIRDGGAPFDPANGQALCGSHHTAKTASERARRLRDG